MSTNTATVSKAALQYRTRKPQYSPYYQCIEDHCEEFKDLMSAYLNQNMDT